MCGIQGVHNVTTWPRMQSSHTCWVLLFGSEVTGPADLAMTIGEFFFILFETIETAIEENYFPMAQV